MNLSGMPDFPKGEPAFVALLKQHTPFVPHWEENRTAAQDELDVRAGLTLAMDFPDPENLLETAVFDFNRFLSEAGIPKGKILVSAKKAAGFSWEAYRVTAGKDSILIEATDTEGIRRALYFVRDLIAASPCLKQKVYNRTPWLRNRISRCFFGPIKRPPFNIDELMNDIDYYPEEYLSRLAHEGVNGLWLTVEFREICDTTIRPAKPDAAKRIAKLRDTVERCRRYGIKTWAFCIEPIYWSLMNNNPIPEGCEELLGPGFGGLDKSFYMLSFCPNSEKAQQYLYECTYSLFKSVPHLGGIISISHGERMTSCLSQIKPTSNGEIPCKRRCDRSIGEILAMTLGSLKRGMHDANPDAELISWLYMPRVEQSGNWITQLPSKLNNDVALAFNFESGVSKYQLGRVRNGGDYWLSEIGPSDRFNLIASAAKGHCEMAAKLQVACSHECATVPYIPAPGLIYRKYRKMKELGVKHVMQCWYFGNYPGVMNEAAGKLAYEDFTTSEDEFLVALAAPEWGRDYPAVVEAWKHFADGYTNYPLDIQFQYYGPMHDGTVWPLHLKQTMTPMTRSWKPDLFPAGDALGEAMKHFELNELAALGSMISSEWHKGMESLRKAQVKGHELEFTLAEALDIMFRSGRNILKFYAMRNALMDEPADSKVLLDGMRKLVQEEIANSLRLAELCRQDARLGYHSEAEVYKYFPAKLEWRANCLKSLLDEDFAEAEKILAKGAGLHDFIFKGTHPVKAGQVFGNSDIRWSFTADADDLVVKIQLNKLYPDDQMDEVAVMISDPKGCSKPVEETLFLYRGRPCTSYKTEQKVNADGWKLTVTIPRERLSYAPGCWFGVQRVVETPKGNVITHDKDGKYIPEPRLYLSWYEPSKLTYIEF